MIFKNKFSCFATGRVYRVRGIVSCKSKNVIYLIQCKACEQQYVGSASKFKERFRVHKSDINTSKVRCGVAKHFTSDCNSNDRLAD